MASINNMLENKSSAIFSIQPVEVMRQPEL